MTTKPPLQKILKGILHTEKDVMQPEKCREELISLEE
jgi:hypothetical protein